MYTSVCLCVHVYIYNIFIHVIDEVLTFKLFILKLLAIKKGKKCILMQLLGPVGIIKMTANFSRIQVQSAHPAAMTSDLPLADFSPLS